MKSLCLSLLLATVGLGVQAADVLFPFVNGQGQAMNVRKLTLYPLEITSFGTVTGDPLYFFTGTNSSVVASNLLNGTWRAEFSGLVMVTTNWYSIPLTNGYINASNWVADSVFSAVPSYSKTASDWRYLKQRGAITSTNGSIAVVAGGAGVGTIDLAVTGIGLVTSNNVYAVGQLGNDTAGNAATASYAANAGTATLLIDGAWSTILYPDGGTGTKLAFRSTYGAATDFIMYTNGFWSALGVRVRNLSTNQLVSTDSSGNLVSSATVPSGSLSGLLLAANFPLLTGSDVTNSAGSLALNLKATGTAGTYAKATFDAQGRETSGVASIDVSSADITGVLKAAAFPALTGSDVTNAAGSLAANLKATGTAGTYVKTTFDAQGRESSGATSIDVSTSDISGILKAAAFPALTGDVTNSAGILATGLKATGTAGTYTKTTFDAQGRETSGTTLAGSDLPSPLTAPVAFLTNLNAMLDSVCIPPGAFYSANLTLPSTTTTLVSVTNLCEGWSFAHGATNEIRVRFALPYDWNAGTVQLQLNALCTGTNTSSVNQTNVVFAVAATALPTQADVSAQTFGTAIWVTNRINQAAYVEGACVSGPVTVGGTPAGSKSILWQIQRLGGQSGDTLTNTSLVLTEARMFFTRNLAMTNSLAASP